MEIAQSIFPITSKLTNPQFSSDVFGKANIINFSVKETELEDQLLSIVVKKENPELEKEKNELILKVSKSKTSLFESENEILKLLTASNGSFFEDEKLVNALKLSKTTLKNISDQLIISESTEKKIDQMRENYRPCAQRASILFLVMNQLSTINEMYQFSMDYYFEIFNNSITNSKQNPNLIERINNLNDFHTYSVYNYACQGIYEKHRLLFAFSLSVKIMEASNKLSIDEYNMFIYEPQTIKMELIINENQMREWLEILINRLDDDLWKLFNVLDENEIFSGGFLYNCC